MFHAIAWTAAALGNTANTEINGISDDILELRANRFFPFQDLWLWGMYAGSATLQRTRIYNSTIRNIAQHHLRPLNASLLPPTNPAYRLYLPQPIRFHANEAIIVDATSGVAMTEQFNAVALVSPNQRPTPIPAGDRLVVRATSTTAAVDMTWTTVTLTFDQELPYGRYALVQSELQSTNAIAHRWILQNAGGGIMPWRPGALSIGAIANRTAREFYDGSHGVMGFFNSNALPRLQVLVDGTDAAHVALMEIVRLGDL